MSKSNISPPPTRSRRKYKFDIKLSCHKRNATIRFLVKISHPTVPIYSDLLLFRNELPGFCFELMRRNGFNRSVSTKIPTMIQWVYCELELLSSIVWLDLEDWWKKAVLGESWTRGYFSNQRTESWTKTAIHIDSIQAVCGCLLSSPLWYICKARNASWKNT